ncbi:hypothetical protein J7T55_002785 [Diaporthe amygdali]|uniref:uncharacterized protein n=1 Tax=Phomopsis amygdali TaxID=1214568 RepID=UPI0022FDF2D3|nr:uncharacterized protein J7T55_002785 [Diaporthe amygdali]KAJ0122273.1 hypothetical protein J7T55_002785 [Diaporthe amygdali]
MPRRTAPIRRPHKKSRFGCQECKRRHVKCDEARPTCGHCLATLKPCVYRSPPPRTTRASSVPTTLRPSSPAATTFPGDARSATSAPSPASVGLKPSTPSNLGASVASPSATPTSSAQYGALDPPLNMRHMQLFSHFIFSTAPSLDDGPSPDREQLQVMMPAALSVPYLVYEMLAFSALHLSHTDASQADYYREEATALQTQALSLFNNSRPEITADTCAPMLMFSGFLGIYTLAEAVTASRADGNVFLDKFVTYLNLHRGVRVVTERAWNLLGQSNLSPVLNRAERTLNAVPSRQSQEQATTISDRLQNMLDNADMGTQSNAACRDAVSRLKLVYQSELSRAEMSGEAQSTSVIWAWPILLSGVFTKLLMERRPEALIILCHYAVLLHWRRRIWLVGDAGRLLIEEMTRFLGTYWKEYLEWPNQMLEES